MESNRMIRSGAILFLRIKKEIVSESLLPRRGRDYRTRVEKHDPCIRCAWKENGGVETGRCGGAPMIKQKR